LSEAADSGSREKSRSGLPLNRAGEPRADRHREPLTQSLGIGQRGATFCDRATPKRGAARRSSFEALGYDRYWRISQLPAAQEDTRRESEKGRDDFLGRIQGISAVAITQELHKQSALHIMRMQPHGRKRFIFIRLNGAQGRNRTTDTAIFSRMLYQLSYLGAAGAPPAERALYGLPSTLSRA
jgi:hypothetical protein